MFLIAEGTAIRAIKPGAEWFSANFRRFTTSSEHLFDKHEVAVDPIGQLGCSRNHKSTVGGAYAEAGFYGFTLAGEQWGAWNGGTLLVSAGDVQYLD